MKVKTNKNEKLGIDIKCSIMADIGTTIVELPKRFTLKKDFDSLVTPLLQTIFSKLRFHSIKVNNGLFGITRKSASFILALSKQKLK